MSGRVVVGLEGRKEERLLVIGFQISCVDGGERENATGRRKSFMMGKRLKPLDDV